MRTHAALAALALLGLLLCSTPCLRAEEAGDGNETEDASPGMEVEDGEETTDEAVEEKPKKEKTTEIEEEADVMVLHSVNFARALDESRFLLVEFCECWVWASARRGSTRGSRVRLIEWRFAVEALCRL